MSRVVSHAPWLLVFGALSVGCAQRGDAPTAARSVRDSAGIQIVTFSSLPDVDYASLGNCPVSIGAENGPEEQLLYAVQSAALLDNGMLAIANGGTDEVRLYDLQGSFHGALGRSGHGPGEFQSLAWVRQFGDTIYVFDPIRRAISLFASSPLRFVRSYSLAGDWLNRAPVLGPFPKGEVVEIRHGLGDAPDMKEYRGIRRPNAPYVRYGADGRMVDTILVVPQGEVARAVIRGGGQTLTMDAPPPFGRSTFSSWVPGALIVSDNASYGFQVRAPSGQLLRVVRVLRPAEAVDNEDLAAYIDAALSQGNPRVRSVHEQVLRAAEPRTTRPASGSVIGDGSGRIWIQDYGLPGSPSGTWHVFTSGGDYLGRVHVPPALTILQLSGSRLVALSKSELDVEHVSVCAIEFSSTT